MLRFFADNARWLTAGLLLTFGSAPGQTYLIALFAGEIKTAYGLTDGGWGGIYTLSTLAAALALFWRGSLADTMPARPLALIITALFALSCLMMAAGGPVWMLAIALFGLRFCGHGMYTHIAMTTTGRWFDSHRGRALAVIGLGYALAEIIWPLPVVLSIGRFGAEATWGFCALITGALFLPAFAVLLARERVPQEQGYSTNTAGLDGRHWTRGEAARHWLLWALLPGMVAAPVFCTMTYFHQSHIAAIKGWTLAHMAPGYAAFAVMMTAGSFLAGWFADRFGPEKLLPLFLLPLTLGLGLIPAVQAVWPWYVILGLLGLSMGQSSTLWGALLPVVYGTVHLGAVRSLATTITVFFTAIGPGLSGFLIDRGTNYGAQAAVISAWSLALCAFGLMISRWLIAKRGETVL